MNPAQLPLCFDPAPEPAAAPAPTPVADRRRARDRARQEAHAAARADLVAAYLFDAANRERLRLPPISLEEFDQQRAWLGF